MWTLAGVWILTVLSVVVGRWCVHRSKTDLVGTIKKATDTVEPCRQKRLFDRFRS